MVRQALWVGITTVLTLFLLFVAVGAFPNVVAGVWMSSREYGNDGWCPDSLLLNLYLCHIFEGGDLFLFPKFESIYRILNCKNEL